MARNIMTIITTMFLTLILATSCSKGSTFFGGEDEQSQTAVPEYYIPEDSANVTVIYSDGTSKPHVSHVWSLSAEDTIRVNGTEAFKATERLEKIAQNEMVFGYNYDKTNRLTVTGLAMSYKGKTIYPKDPSMMLVKGSREVAETAAKPFYELSATNYQLVYGALVLASARQMFVVDEGYIPSFENNVMLDHRHNNVWAGQVKNKVLPIYCGNEELFAQKWDDGSLRDSTWVPFNCLNSFVLDLHEVKTSDFNGMQKVYTFDANGCVTVNGVIQKVTRQADASVVGSVKYNGVEYRDSVHRCWYDAKTLTLVSTDSADITFVHREGWDKVTKRVGFKTIEVKVKDVLCEFKHTSFPATGTVNGLNINVHHKDNGIFQLLFTDGSKSGKETVKYDVDHDYKYSLPSYVSSDLKGKTINFKINGNVATAEVLVVTFLSRTVGDIVYDGKNYKEKENANCQLTLKSATFGESTVVITATHDSETVTATVPVSYNALKGYERVGDPVHDSWNTAYGTSTGFGITCNNHVVVREVYTDGSKGSSFDLPYKSTNTWVVSGKTSFVVESLSSVLNVREDIVNGSANIAGNIINFAHSMSAEKVSKGNFSYQPSACEAVARYITVTSSTTARVDIYHDNTKVGEATIPVNITEKPGTPDYPGQTVWCGVVDAYVDGSNVATWESAQLIAIAVNNGEYRLYHRNVNSNSWGNPNGVVVSAAYANSISNNRPAAMIGNTADSYTHGSCQWQDQGSWSKIVYFDANGGVARVISEISKTIGGESSNNCRKPLRGTWSNGKVVADGVTYVVKGSQD
jgi:hypothetical protein